MDTSSFKCRADQAADGLFVLVAGTFVSKVRTHDEYDVLDSDVDDDVLRIQGLSMIMMMVMLLLMMMDVVDDDG